MNTTVTYQNITPLEVALGAFYNLSKKARAEFLKVVNETSTSQKPKVKMTEEEFYAKIDASMLSAEAGHVISQRDGESIDDFVDRLLCTK